MSNDETSPVVSVLYRNYRGESSRRKIIPKTIRFGANESLSFAIIGIIVELKARR